MASKNAWFKHYNMASEGQTIAQLWAENDTETIAFYWTVLEMVSRWEDETKRGFWAGNLSIFRAKLGMKSQRSRKLLSKITERFSFNLEWISDQSFQLSIPKWLELQEKRGGKSKAKKEQKADRGERTEDRGQKTDCDVSQTLPSPLFELWNKHRGNLKRADAETDSRKKHSKARWKANPDENYWVRVIQKMATDPFCNGENDRTWVADIDFFLRPDTHVKVLEGKYETFKKQQKPVDHFCGIAEV